MILVFFHFGILLHPVTTTFTLLLETLLKIMHDCQECSYKGVSSENLEEHVAENHIFGELFSFILDENEDCKKPLQIISLNDKQDEKENHVIQRKEDKMYSCNECSYETKFSNNIRFHIDAVHKNIVQFKCNMCDYRAYQKVAITEHLKRYHKNGDEMNIITLKCKPCENNIPHENCSKVKQRTRKQHILDEAKVKEKGLKRKQIKFNCNECNYEGKFQQNLLSHIDAIHKNIVRFQCNICDYKAHQKHAISEHFWRNHNNGKKLDILTLSCEQCEKNIPHENCCKIKQRNRKQKLIGESLKCEINDCIFSTNFRQSLSDCTVVYQNCGIINQEIIRIGKIKI